MFKGLKAFVNKMKKPLAVAAISALAICALSNGAAVYAAGNTGDVPAKLPKNEKLASFASLCDIYRFGITAKYAIEGDLVMNGTGTGYHSKISLLGNDCGISFGIQRDEKANPPYTGKNAIMVENVFSNAPGQQQYDWTGITIADGQKIHLLMTMDTKGNIDIYVDGNKVKTYQNLNLVSRGATPVLQGSARLSGDFVDTTFSNVCTKNGSETTFTNMESGYFDAISNDKSHKNASNGLESTYSPGQRSAHIWGVINYPGGGDWDSEYENGSENVIMSW